MNKQEYVTGLRDIALWMLHLADQLEKEDMPLESPERQSGRVYKMSEENMPVRA
jgi:hypothetical protein